MFSFIIFDFVLRTWSMARTSLSNFQSNSLLLMSSGTNFFFSVKSFVVDEVFKITTVLSLLLFYCCLVRYDSKGC